MIQVFIASSKTRFWTWVVLLFVVGMAYLAVKATRGLAGGYLHASIGERLKSAMVLFHGFGSLILALMIPNNFLVKIAWFDALYAQDGLWIAVSIVILLFFFLVAIGMLFTLLTSGLRKQGRGIDGGK